MSRRIRLLATVTCLAVAASTGPSVWAAQQPASAPAAWRLGDLYSGDAAWDAARSGMQAKLSKLQTLKGTLGASAASLRDALDQISAVRREIQRLDAYASLKSDEDTRVAANQERRQSADALSTRFSEATAFVAPEVSALGSARVEAAIASEPGLTRHAYALRTMLRQASHTLSAEQESLLASASDALSQPQRIYELLDNADLPWPTVEIRGEKVVLDQNAYVRFRDDRDPAVRQQVFQAFWSVYRSFQRTMGAIYAAHLKGVVFDARAHKYATSLASSLSNVNTPEAVYQTLVAEANAGLPELHRYLKLRSRLLGLQEPKYSDIYAALVKPPRTYTLEEAESLTLQAVRPLGDAYVQSLGKHFREGWMDASPRPGKRSGAYMNPEAYDVHPYVLLSFNGNYESMSTVAHEWGHAMHSVLGNAAQPFETATYGIFVAEIPSTTNEMLLADHVTAHAASREERIYAVTQQLENIRQNFFRQTMFAEFELRAHEQAEADQPLTGESLAKTYLDLLRRYYGDAQGVMQIEDLYGAEWAYIPHFYNDFYVYQYATSISAAAFFADGIEQGTPGMRDRYLDMLKAGGSADPYLVVKAAGVDMATPEPYRALVRRMGRLTDELERLTAEQASNRGATRR